MSGGDGRRWGAGAAGGTVDDDRRMIDRVMMLRFRPIAPKPVGDGNSAGAGVDQFSNKRLLLSNVRPKRKYVRVRSRNKTSGGSGGGRKRSPSSEKSVVTLQLLPEKAVKGEDDRPSAPSTAVIPSSSNPSPSPEPHLWIIGNPRMKLADLTAAISPIESWVIIESVGTTPCLDPLELGRTDEEKVTRLMSAACPGFVSDLSNRVQCVNRAYEEMVRKGFASHVETGFADVAMGLSVKGGWGRMELRCGAAFSCRVRVQDTWQEERRSRVVPCDVWRMDSGGFAWRLDVRAALSLGSSLDH